MKFYWFLLLFVVFGCSQTQKKEDGAETGADQVDESREMGFPDDFSYFKLDKATKEENLGPCESKQELTVTSEIFKIASSCYYSGDLKKSYYILKRLLASPEIGGYKVKVLNNLGVIQAQWGNYNLALSLLKDSADIKPNELNTFNYQQVRLLMGQKIENNNFLEPVYGLNDPDQDLTKLKAQLAFGIENFDEYVQFSEKLNLQDEKTLINYIYGLYRAKKFGVANIIVKENKEVLERNLMAKDIIEDIESRGSHGNPENGSQDE
ncbi:MAG: hypothetical protein H6621_11940 [Halobacteriovoraceae bacterium]|nr:hypothetical protein [Halobacteriovoraceae bacterium]MCB9095772.1 hypothetical protein [Halobacteriovoraceae bacterium]